VDSISIDESEPLPVRRPTSAAELGELVAEAAGTGRGVYPVGGRTMLDVGLPPQKSGFAVDMTGMNGVIDYPARDMTITVQAGITLAKLQETLAKEGQWLPVDVPHPEAATIGGAVALNVSGPRRLGYGTLRDYVIGINFITDDGREVKAGGRVVKNVAGYDLMKLQTGAVGTLGVITQLTLKVRPKPESSVLVTFGCHWDELPATLDLLHGSNSRPCAVELLSQSAGEAAGVSPPSSYEAHYLLAVGFEEKAATVDWQVATLKDELKGRDVAESYGPAAGALWQSLAELQRRPESRFIWKTSVPPSKVADVMRTVPARVPYLVHAEAMNGIMWFHAPAGFEPGTAYGELPWMEQRLAVAFGQYVMRRCPTEWKRELRVWGRPTDERELMRHVKRTLDPKNVFNPGRLFGDL
jgi:glycolate oxidase FAD binding subunit